MKVFEAPHGTVVTTKNRVFIEEDNNGALVEVSSLLEEVSLANKGTITLPEGYYSVKCIITIEKD